MLIEKGQSIERPDYGGAGAKAVAGLKEEEGEEEVKKNFEQTSDEDD